ncbi:hypothetical protein EC919_114120 [Pseudomonas graminis]|nr:hypothetical protein EC919_114120 [Pseudomonas graminis]
MKQQKMKSGSFRTILHMRDEDKETDLFSRYK